MPVVESSSKPWRNIMVSDSAWRMYYSSREPKEGYIKHEYSSPWTDTKSVVYRKYLDAVAWRITKMEFDNYGATKIVLTDWKENYSIQISNPQGGLSRATKAFIAVTANADFTRDLYISFYVKKTVKTFDDGSEKEYENVRAYVCYYDEDIAARLDERPELIDIKSVPLVEMTEKKWKKTYDYSVQDRYYENIFAEMQERIPKYERKQEITVTSDEIDALDIVETSANPADDLPF